MRSQLLVGGTMIGLTGLAFFVLQIPFAYFWSIPFMIGGLIMAAVSPFLSESEGPVRPPEGYIFCVFCSVLLPAGTEKCENCGGHQPRE
jgi:hypothetical protein